jgi:hypothetical protein
MPQIPVMPQIPIPEGVEATLDDYWVKFKVRVRIKVRARPRVRVG